MIKIDELSRSMDELLQTKLIPPLLQSSLISRPRLIERLCEDFTCPGGFARKLTLFCAPAGYGKTSLAVSWLQSVDSPFAWLTLDENDNDPRRFSSYFAAAFTRLNAQITASLQAILNAPQPPAEETILILLINALETIHEPYILVLDDYHVLQLDRIHDQISFLLDHQPRNLHLVICSRVDPSLPLHRLRAQGELMDVRQDDLRFNAKESAEFLRKVIKYDLGAEEIAALTRRTEGWIAGLHLAALSLRTHEDAGSFVRSFTGSNRFILDYLFEEVFRQQSPEVRSFLLATSVLDRFNASLSTAVSGDTKAGARLEFLDRENLFVIPQDTERQWYRYHRLFSDLLLHQLHLAGEPPERLLHQRACDWHRRHGSLLDAIPYALAAQDWKRAVELVPLVSSELLSRGEATTLIRWIRQFPKDILIGQPALSLTYAWALMLAGQFLPSQEILIHLASSALPNSPFAGQIAAAQALLAYLQGDIPQMIERAESALADLSEDDRENRSLVALNLGMTYWHMGNIATAQQHLEKALSAMHLVGNYYGESMAAIFLARIQAVRGELHIAISQLEKVVEQFGQSLPLPLAHMDLGTLYYETNRIDLAADHLERSLAASRRSGNIEFQIASHLLFVRLGFARGDLQAAQNSLAEASRLEKESGMPLRMRGRISALELQAALWAGDLEGASRLAPQIIDGLDAHPFYRFMGIAQAQLAIAQGRRAEAQPFLEQIVDQAQRNGWGYGLIVGRIYQTLAAESTPDAMEALSAALRLAEQEGYLRSFVEAGASMKRYLLEAIRRGLHPQVAGQILAALQDASQEEYLPKGQIEPLSDRELEVLRFVAAGLSNRQIAEQLVLSPSTVKSHVHHICGKLGASNRAHAVKIAGELTII